MFEGREIRLVPTCAVFVSLFNGTTFVYTHDIICVLIRLP